MVDERAIAERYWLLMERGVLDERGRRLWAAAEARSHGRGGIAAVVRATGVSESTVLRGLAELESSELPAPGRVRRPGGGKKPIRETHPGIEEELERLVAPETRGDPESPLRWTSKLRAQSSSRGGWPSAATRSARARCCAAGSLGLQHAGQ